MKKVLISMLQLHLNNGTARNMRENIEYFKARNYEVHIVAMTINYQIFGQMGVTLHKTLPWIKSTGLWRRKWYDFQVQRLRKQLKPDLTLGHGDIQDQDVLSLHNSVFLASELIHGKPLSPDHEMAVTHGDQLRKQKFKKMIANSQLMKDDTVKRFAVPAEKIVVVYPSYNRFKFFPKPQERSALRERFKFPDKVIVALVTSGNFKKRGLDLFIEAIHQLPQDVLEKVSFRVVGKDEAKQYLDEKVTFDPSLSDIENYYNAIDVMVLPARFEEFGRVVLESMGCGLTVITTDKVGVSELIQGESREFVIPAASVKPLAEALKKLIMDSALRERLGKLNLESAKVAGEDRLNARFDEVFLP